MKRGALSPLLAGETEDRAFPIDPESEGVAHVLAAAGATETPDRYPRRAVFGLEEETLAQPERRRLATPHLPQGAPLSPTLAKVADADYTRYADDLLFCRRRGFDRLKAILTNSARYGPASSIRERKRNCQRPLNRISKFQASHRSFADMSDDLSKANSPKFTTSRGSCGIKTVFQFRPCQYFKKP